MAIDFTNIVTNDQFNTFINNNTTNKTPLYQYLNKSTTYIKNTDNINEWIKGLIGVFNLQYTAGSDDTFKQYSDSDSDIQVELKAHEKTPYTENLQKYINKDTGKTPYKNANANVYGSEGDGTCLIHSFLNSVSPAYRSIIDTGKTQKQIIGKLFRRYVFAPLFDDIYDKSEIQFVENIDNYLEDIHIIKLSDTYNVNILVFVQSQIYTSLHCPRCRNNTDENPQSSLQQNWVLMYKADTQGHFDTIYLNNNGKPVFLVSPELMQPLLNNLPNTEYWNVRDLLKEFEILISHILDQTQYNNNKGNNKGKDKGKGKGKKEEDDDDDEDINNDDDDDDINKDDDDRTKFEDGNIPSGKVVMAETTDTINQNGDFIKGPTTYEVVIL